MPTPLIVIGAVLLFFVLLFSLRIRITVAYREEVSLTLGFLCFRLRLLPRKKGVKWRRYSPKKAERIARKKQEKEARKAAKKEKKKAAKKAKKAAEKALPPEKKKRKATVAENIGLVRALVAALFRKTRKHLRLHAARLHLRVATGDAATTAVLYGVVCQSLSYLLALLDRITKLKAAPPSVSVCADYLAEKTHADIQITLSLRLWGALAAACSVAFAFIKTKQDQKHTRKIKGKSTAKAARAKAQKGTHHG